MSRDDYLFSKYDLNKVTESVVQKMGAEIDGLAEAQLLGTAPDAMARYFADKYRLDVPQLHEDQITVDPVETRVDVSQDPGRFIRERSGPFYVAGTDFRYFVPYSGEGDLFRCQGNQISMNPPRAEIESGHLVFSFVRTDANADAVKAEFDQRLGHTKDLLAGVAGIVEAFNAQLEAQALARINARRERLQKTGTAAAALGYPVRRRDGAAQTFAVPEVKRKLAPTMPPVSTGKPEPALDAANYEHILTVIGNMVTVMERSPSAFREMREEDLRQHFLVQLNGQFEGMATGETFNFEGKTDILIRADGRNIFIAECKFWEGPKGFNDAIDQLLGYTTWRDTKTALLIFNRGRALSTVLSKIPELVRARPEFIREITQDGETRFRFILHHRDDKQRELTLTVMVFEIPAEEPARS
jgi:hypothetical protein